MDELSSIDPQQVRALALGGATDTEIADFIGSSETELQRQCGPLLRQARAARCISLRKKQTAAAIDGSVNMLTFLGKHELGQTDRQSDNNDDRPEPQLDTKVG